MSPRVPLHADQIEILPDDYLDVEFSFIKTSAVAQQLADIKRSEQDFILTWVKRLAVTHTQLGYQFITQTIDALERLDRNIIEDWALHAADMYDQFGLRAALNVIQDVGNYIQRSQERAHGSLFDKKKNVLLHFLRGLSGRELKLAEAETAYTDSETIFLPPVMMCLQTPEENFLVYKIMVAYFWAQTRFGTFRLRLSAVLEQQSDPERFLKLFYALETRRLEACIERDLPGLYRDLNNIRQQLDEEYKNGDWIRIAAQLNPQASTVHDVLRLTTEHVDHLDPPVSCFFQGKLNPLDVETYMDARILKEKSTLRTILRNIMLDGDKEEIDPDETDKTNTQEAGTESVPEAEFKARGLPDVPDNDGMKIAIVMDDKPVALPENAKGLISSIIQDLGELPDDYLVPAGPGEYDTSLLNDKELDPDEVWKGTYHEEGAFLYDEWDHRRQHYHKNWCAVREKIVPPLYDGFAAKTLAKYSGLIKRLRKTFEAMRDEDRLLKRQVYGDDVDIDALVEALADAYDGREMTEHLFTRTHRMERNIAVCFMVDMSGSTKGWINDAERESLILLSETLETLGDRYAIYGFSGMARKRCEIYKVKGFDEAYSEEIEARIAGIEPKDYTRMGFAIRHLTTILNEVDAKTRVLITLSDGKPDDYDNYRGEYGIEDTRRALIEARYNGIHPYCITIDETARDYLPHMYGPASFTVIDDVMKLPLKVSDIYRRLTS